MGLLKMKSDYLVDAKYDWEGVDFQMEGKEMKDTSCERDNVPCNCKNCEWDECRIKTCGRCADGDVYWNEEGCSMKRMLQLREKTRSGANMVKEKGITEQEMQDRVEEMVSIAGLCISGNCRSCNKMRFCEDYDKAKQIVYYMIERDSEVQKETAKEICAFYDVEIKKLGRETVEDSFGVRSLLFFEAAGILVKRIRERFGVEV